MNKILGNKTAIAAFVAPSLILFGGIIFYSIIMSFRYSLLDWNGFGEGIFVGFSNYAKMFQDKVFLRSAVKSFSLNAAGEQQRQQKRQRQLRNQCHKSE